MRPLMSIVAILALCYPIDGRSADKLTAQCQVLNPGTGTAQAVFSPGDEVLIRVLLAVPSTVGS
jgi:hypothetical protein